MKIIEQFNEYSAKIEAGAGYGDIVRVDRDNLIEFLQRLPQGDILLSSLPHASGRGLIAKPGSETEPHWYVIAPTIPNEVQA